jgi:hypothetical protein
MLRYRPAGKAPREQCEFYSEISAQHHHQPRARFIKALASDEQSPNGRLTSDDQKPIFSAATSDDVAAL